MHHMTDLRKKSPIGVRHWIAKEAIRPTTTNSKLRAPITHVTKQLQMSWLPLLSLQPHFFFFLSSASLEAEESNRTLSFTS